ncbi:tRNA-dihydrouridine(47) synthase [NAD(P)(+)]-like isoform X2 [Neopsephotus bourkii]|uniref:tRNA-dihydrouridine(47) synthase [NAD(P)(+)]-like isoform X2 n=1 Tax=Neopsephotus bourkii TaxID=309878 RepID=UPI002AA5D36B|nr:tRNA-dihydrouridine(47) synthase [NAD(P)(+)]-like isoform X2 [Neopsephotus bourkii]
MAAVVPVGPGVAPVRARFLISKEQFHAYLRDRGEEEEKKEEQQQEEEEEVGVVQGEPPAKRVKAEGSGRDEESREDAGAGEKEPVGRKRARGQNKSRPCMKPNCYEQNRLCPAVTQGSADKCCFGPRCRFLHDLGEYMALKPPDLGRRCVLFETFGKCAYGATCRFAQAHLGAGFRNIVNTELAGQWEGKALVRNSLSKELQHRLRKRKFSFKRAELFLRALAKPRGDGRKGGNATGCSAGEQEVPNCTTPQEGHGDDPACPVLAEQGEDPKADGLQSPSPTDDEEASSIQTMGSVTDEDVIKPRPCEKKKLEIQGKLYLAPLTTCGNLPFRRICKRLGADVTCGEMAVCTNLLQGQASEWALLKRHHTEDIFGVQLEGAFPDTMTKCAELLNQTIEVDFVDINVGCPIDLVYKKVLDVPLTVKIRTGVQEKINVAHKLLPRLREWGAALVTLHGRSREQRYTRSADWDYIAECAQVASPMPLFGNGDILSYEDANRAMQTGVSGIMIARYIPVGLLEFLPQKINERPPYYMGRDYLETLMASQNVDDWIRISELLLGPVPPNFTFLPKHKANSYR